MSNAAAELRVDRPVFVIGTGRCGLTPLMDLIAYHPAFAWLSQYNGLRGGNTRLALLSRVVDHWPLRGRWKFRSRYVPRHDEVYAFWGGLFHGFGRPIRDLVGDDASPYVRSRIGRAVGEIVRYQGKQRFIAEYSGWSRIDFMKAIFPDARFIHIVRDGRAVANSLTHVDYWLGWEGVYKWRLGVPPAPLLEQLAKYEHSFLALAGIFWKILIDNIRAKAARLPAGDFLELRYEDVVKEPRAKALECIAFAGLEDSPAFQAHLASVSIVNANAQQFRIPGWRDNMTLRQVAMLEDILGEDLARYGYV